MDERLYWLWLQKGLGFGANISAIVDFFGSARAIYEAGADEWRLSGMFSKGFFGLTSQGLERLREIPLEYGQEILSYCDSEGISVLTPDSPLYPSKLLKITDYPAVLFARGEVEILNADFTIAVVGTREPSDYGKRVARLISLPLAESGAVIVSGGALGVDGIAHRCAIEKGQKTVLVMGCGHNTDYLKENAPLRAEVEKNGVTLSEYPPKTQAGRGYFPLRNRIISALSKGVVVVEAGLKSGTLNTARHAKKQGKDIFVVPGDISSKAYAGSNKLIVDGAKAIFSGQDVLERYYYYYAAKSESSGEPMTLFDGIDAFSNGKPKRAKRSKVVEKAQKEVEPLKQNGDITEISKNPPEGVSKNAMLVYNVMKSGFGSLDEIVKESALPVRKVLISLTELEIAGAVKSLGANNYEIA